MPTGGTLIMDTTADAELTIGQFQSYQIRTGIITGLEIDGNPDPLVLQRAQNVANFPQFRTSVPGGSPYMLLSSFTLKPMKGCSDIASVWFRYETPPLAGISSYIIRDGGAIQEVESTFTPGTYQLIQQNWIEAYSQAANWNQGSPWTQKPAPPAPVTPGQNPAVDAAYAPWANKVPNRACRLRFSRPLRTISITKVGFGAPGNAAPTGTGSIWPVAGTNWPLPLGALGAGAPILNQDMLGFCNADTWWQKPPGYWRLNKFETEVNVYSGTYTVAMAAESKVIEHWGQMEIIANKATGYPVIIDPVLLRHIASLPYQFGPIWPVPVGGESVPDGSGVVFWGMSPQASFFNIIGTDYSQNYG